MPIKGLFNQKQNHEIIIDKIAELEKKQKRLNAIEVHIKRILKWEEEITPLLKKGILEKKEKLTTKTPVRKATTKEKDKEKIREEASIMETAKKTTLFLKAVHKMDKQIGELEKNVTQIHQSQMELTSRLNLMEEQLSRLQEENMKSTENLPQEKAMVIKEIHIDKFYLDKYEQNNNFAQLGIKELSGALNIGATYGKEVLPKELSDQLKEDMNEFKGMKKEFGMGEEESSSMNGEQTFSESSGSEEASYDNETFTEIPIEVVDDND
ncbi:hypothetical protein KHA96_13660 [Bacillus sp. FJAT-49711]|uniref:hypothetical protein n=1 Tax=Bacillus sp. FJAT-49711 TaxID=2833585 RepID=UPI001BC9F489|nr:hypothetical protein [Bacillus sp. FJAT-49711]MBS4219368.1 hypothetical protein [Bacillus sp. FJAT-49711]